MNTAQLAALNKAALDAACELDSLKNVAAISEEEKGRIAQLVERVYAACEMEFDLFGVGA